MNLASIFTASAAIAQTPQWVSSNTTTSGSSASSSIPLTKPANTAQNDLLVAALMLEKGSDSAANVTPPTGWTLIRRTNQATDIGMATYYKVAGASEPGSYTFSVANSLVWAASITRITGAHPTSPINQSAGTNGSTGSTVRAPTLTTTVPNALVLAFYTNAKSATYTPVTGTTERYDSPNISGGKPSNMLATFEQTAAGATGNKDATPDQTDKWVGQQIAIAPATPSFALSGNQVAISNGSATPSAGDHTHFGDVLVDGQFSRTYTISNSGTGTLNLTGTAPNYVTISGTDAASFSVSTQPAASVAPAGSTTFVVTFAPSSKGLKNATVHVAHSANGGPHQFAIAGTGTVPEIPAFALSGNQVAISNGSATPSAGDHTHFGDVLVDGQFSRTYTISNSGTGTLNLTGTAPNYVTISGTDAASFSVSTQPAASVAPAGSTTFVVTFAPSSKGLKNATVHVAHSANGGPHQFAIAGTGTAPEIAVFAGAGTDVDNLLSSDTGVVDFGENAYLGEPVTRTFTLKNTGTASLTGLSVQRDSEGTPADFIVDSSSLTSTLGPDATTSFDVSFVPTATGNRSAVLVIASNDANNGRYLINLVGFGIAGTGGLTVTREVPEDLNSTPDAVGLIKLTAPRGTFTRFGPKGVSSQGSTINGGTEITLHAVPRRGFVFSHWEGTTDGTRQTGRRLTFVMPARAVNLTAVFVTDPFYGLTARPVFRGLVRAAEGSTKSNDDLGSIIVTSNRSTGSFSGRVTLGGVGYPIRGFILGVGEAWFGSNKQPTREVSIGERSLSMKLVQGDLHCTLGTAEIGNLGIGGNQGSVAIIATAELYDAAHPLPENWRNHGAAGDEAFFTAQMQVTAGLPQEFGGIGHSFTSVRVTKTGRVSLAGRLADGSILTSTTAVCALAKGDAAELAEQGVLAMLPLYQSLQTPGNSGRRLGGSVMGDISVIAATHSGVGNERQGLASSSLTLFADLDWLRPAVAKMLGDSAAARATQIFSNGWPEGVVLQLNGHAYDDRKTLQDNLNGAAPILRFHGGKLEEDGIEIVEFHVAGNEVVKANAKDRRFSLVFNQYNGTIRGTFAPNWAPATKRQPNYFGVLVQDSQTGAYGAGFFVSRIPGDVSPESGCVEFGLDIER